MFLLKLFHESEAVAPIAARLAGEGRVRVGRDPAADWVVPDTDREVSRTHLELVVDNGALVMTPLGANGVFNEMGEQFASGEPHPLRPGDAVCFGKYRMAIEAAPDAEGSAALDGTILASLFGINLDVPTAWPEGALNGGDDGADALLVAFCRGADLDVSAFSGEDAGAVLERAGAIYRQTVLGLADLMSARSAIKNDHRLERTTIAADGNNPFKWAPSRRLASDLLLRHDVGFLAGPEAARDSFQDVKKHMLATVAGFRAMLRGAFAAIRPAAVESAMSARKSMLQSQAAACWAEYARLHDALVQDCERGTGEAGAAFSGAYAACLEELDRQGHSRA
ncbi:FHA domain-containing protein [Sphingosinicella sp. LHD-64]|uniref:type VI secretion system-associated FHA domain protein n=1 Tax=Sphingosinicella sp. LHD-64 TaxID=3072139 RepID=UPI00280DB024|nr:type VI secretion system-associated FHA domain protein [Sphingosinicella sp. LHD-64]MDQ8755309.1 FHA domain-containing protein [Sphingosinicella sp. LHD-64]